VLSPLLWPRVSGRGRQTCLRSLLANALFFRDRGAQLAPFPLLLPLPGTGKRCLSPFTSSKPQVCCRAAAFSTHPVLLLSDGPAAYLGAWGQVRAEGVWIKLTTAIGNSGWRDGASLLSSCNLRWLSPSREPCCCRVCKHPQAGPWERSYCCREWGTHSWEHPYGHNGRRGS